MHAYVSAFCNSYGIGDPPVTVPNPNPEDGAENNVCIYCDIYCILIYKVEMFNLRYTVHYVIP